MIEELIDLIERPQFPNRQGYDHLSIFDLLKEVNVPGVSVCVIKDFEVHWSKGYGFADVLSGDKVNENTLFQAASISKCINAMAVIKAAELGLFSLDEDINNVLKSWKAPKDFSKNRLSITPKMLASHTSGLTDGFGFPGYLPSETLPSVIQILDGDRLSNVEKPMFERKPYEVFKYSGAGSIILQQLIVDAFGKSYSEILNELVFKPLNMNKSTFCTPSLSGEDLTARAHGSSGEALESKWHVYPEKAAAGLWTTAEDLAKFVIEVQLSVLGKSNKVLSREGAYQMINPVGVGDYGVGFRVLKEGQGWFFEHGGGNWGFRCQLISHYLKGYGLIVMTNGSQGSTVLKVIKERVESHYGWDSVMKPAI
jgi:CubicO group peptidase (beta-lactamase class C family)